jgi:phage terminase Nu1 subunit (DNA packaging protein)
MTAKTTKTNFKLAGLPAELPLKTLCYLIGVNAQRVAQLAEAGIVRRTERGQYSIDSVPRFVEWQRKQSLLPAEFQDTKLELLKQKAELGALEVSRVRGEYVKAEAVRETWCRLCTVFRTRMLAIPAKVAPMLLNRSVAEIFAVLTREINEALEVLSSIDPKSVTRSEDEDEDEQETV